MGSSPDTGPSAVDADQIARAQRGDREALEHVLTEVAPTIQRFGLRMCGNAQDAEDVLQDTLISIAEHLREFEGRSSLSSWVFTLTRTACSRRRRGLRNQPALSDAALVNTADPSPSPEGLAQSHELTSALSRALDALPNAYREVILLRDVEGLSAPEAAEVLALSVDALKSRLHRAREALREALRPLLETTVIAPHATCPDVTALWSKKMDGDLSHEDCAAMEQHLAQCAACNGACTALRHALLACQNVRTQNVPKAVQAQVREAMQVWVTRSEP